MQNLSIPKEKGTIFVSPELPMWSGLLTQNKFVLENIPYRRTSRGELLSIAREYSKNILDISFSNNVTENIIGTGHQAKWHHCGIWIKNLSSSLFAKAVKGLSVHLVLDHDICDTVLVLPKLNVDKSWRFERIQIEPLQKSVPLEFRSIPKREYIRTFYCTVINKQVEQLCNNNWPEFALIENDAISSMNNVADLITYLQSKLNSVLGLKMLYLPVSKLSRSDAFINFLTSILVNARHFTSIYNSGITSFFEKHKSHLKSEIQKLTIDKMSDTTELPFWIVSPNGSRTTLVVKFKACNSIQVGTIYEKLGNLDSSCLNDKSDQLRTILKLNGCQLRPKAITLTLFARLFLADWFVHGIGATKYESVTDYIVGHYYKIKPPKYGITTTTMTLPLLNCDVFSKDSIGELKHKLHNIKHNPELYIDPSMPEKEPVKSLIKLKKEKIVLAQNRDLTKSSKKSAWESLSMINKELYKYANNTAEILETENAKYEKYKNMQKVLDYREFFFGLFPEKELRKLKRLFYPSIFKEQNMCDPFAECKSRNIG